MQNTTYNQSIMYNAVTKSEYIEVPEEQCILSNSNYDHHQNIDDPSLRWHLDW